MKEHGNWNNPGNFSLIEKSRMEVYQKLMPCGQIHSGRTGNLLFHFDLSKQKGENLKNEWTSVPGKIHYG